MGLGPLPISRLLLSLSRSLTDLSGDLLSARNLDHDDDDDDAELQNVNDQFFYTDISVISVTFCNTVMMLLMKIKTC